MGVTPIHKMRFPKSSYRLKIERTDYPEIFAVFPRYYPELQEVNLSFSLEKYKQNPPGMVRIPGTRSDPKSVVQDLDIAQVQDDFWMDQFEVTNKDFQKFVDSGGYQNRKFWKVPFIKDGRTLSFEKAMTYFHDATGRPGPIEWEVNHFPSDRANYPVTGISWYEAAAYAEFAGKSLPTIYHWYHASGSGMNNTLIPASNFGGSGPHAIGNQKAMSSYGTLDMAGNVSE
jgi:formylglycine-generating enzyme required for sulfatase activity